MHLRCTLMRVRMLAVHARCTAAHGLCSSLARARCRTLSALLSRACMFIDSASHLRIAASCAAACREEGRGFRARRSTAGADTLLPILRAPAGLFARGTEPVALATSQLRSTPRWLREFALTGLNLFLTCWAHVHVRSGGTWTFAHLHAFTCVSWNTRDAATSWRSL